MKTLKRNRLRKEVHHLMKSEEYFWSKQFIKAFAEIQAALEITPGDPVMREWRAAINSKLGDYEGSLQECKLLLKTDPNNVNLVFLAGHNENMLLNPRKGIRFLNRVILLNPKELFYRHHRGYSYYLLKDYDKALVEANAVLKHKPSHLEALQLKAWSLTNKKKWREAINIFTDILKYDPSYCETHYYRGLAYKASGQFDKALWDFEKAIQFNAWPAQSHYERAGLKLKAGDIESAAMDFRKAGEGGLYKALKRVSKITRQKSKDFMRDQSIFVQNVMKSNTGEAKMSLNGINSFGELGDDYPGRVYRERHFRAFEALTFSGFSQKIAFDKILDKFSRKIPDNFDSFIVQFRLWRKQQK